MTASPTDAATPLLSVEAVSRHFTMRAAWPWQPSTRMTAVDAVSFDVHRGDALGIVGESGCGKSTLARMVVGLLKPSEGSMTLDGTPLPGAERGHPRAIQRRIQMIFQDPLGSLNPRRTVGDLIAAPLVGLLGWPREKRRRRVEELMSLVGLRPEFIHRLPHEFSGGQCQRIGIARALAAEADILILDEPVSALDVSIQAQILELLADLRQKLGLTYLFISHDLAVIRYLCNRVMVMNKGQVVEQGITAEVLGSPRHDYTQTLIGAVMGETLAATKRSSAPDGATL